MAKKRLYFVNLAIFACFSVILLRLLYWQISPPSDLKKQSLLQTAKLESVNPIRGTIYAQDGYPLAQNQTVYLLSIYKPNLKQSLTDVVTAIDKVNPTFSSDNQNILTNFAADDSIKWFTFSTYFDQSAMTQLAAMPGISFAQKAIRFYPEDKLASPLIGKAVTSNFSDLKGITGLESFYNQQLTGKTGYNWLTQDATGKIVLTNAGWQQDPLDGQNIHLYLNRSIQYQIEKILQAGVEQYQADSGSITIMNPQTGGIIAMTSFYASASAVASTSATATPSAKETVPNPVISQLFEPGSIFKPLIMSMALDTKAITPDYICTECNHPLTIGQYTITNWDNEIHPNTNLADIIKNSDNIGMSQIILRLGLDSFLKYYSALELDQKSGIDLPSEARPLTKTSWPQIDLATASFGQGIAITQLQMLKAFNVIANDGQLVEPKMAASLTDNRQTITNQTNPASKRIYQSSTIKTIKGFLKYGVENGVVAKFKPDDIEVCAKSGTAQVAVKGGYVDSQTVASYVGFSPCNNPKFTMIVTINNPRSSPWGSSTAAPIWYQIAASISKIL